MLVRLALVTCSVGLLLAAVGCGSSKPPLWTAPGGGTGKAESCCADQGGRYSLGSADIQNRGRSPLTITRVALVWERGHRYGHPGPFAQFLVGRDKQGDYGDGYEWPVSRTMVAGHRRAIPGAVLAPNETGQLIVGIHLPHRRTMHLKAMVVVYTYRDHVLTLQLPMNNWYCYTTQAECDRLSSATRST